MITKIRMFKHKHGAEGGGGGGGGSLGWFAVQTYLYSNQNVKFTVTGTIILVLYRGLLFKPPKF